MTRTFVYSISAEESGTKITDYLRNHGYSRHILTCLKHTDDTVLVNGLGVYMNYVLQPDDRLTIVIPEETPSEHIVPVNLPFQYYLLLSIQLSPCLIYLFGLFISNQFVNSSNKLADFRFGKLCIRTELFTFYLHFLIYK